MGAAQEVTGVDIHCASRPINHEHLSLSDPYETRPVFFRRFHGEFSAALNALLRREGYDAPGQIFDDRATHTMRLLDAEAQAAHLVYEAAQFVAAGLVRDPKHTPDFVFDFGLWKRGALRIQRPDFYFDPRFRPDFVELRFRPPAKLLVAFGGDLDRLIHHMNRLLANAVRELNKARCRPVAGAQRIRRIHPYDEPRTMRAPSSRRVPIYKSGAAGLAKRVVHARACQEVRAFRDAHRRGRHDLQEGKPAEFPYGTWKMRHEQNVDVADPEPALVITGPEPTLDEVLEGLENGSVVSETGVPEMLEKVRNAFRDESESIAEDSDLEMVATQPSGDGEGSVELRHRSDVRAPSSARRIVVRRDIRRGRPRKKVGGDPPKS
ncbi:MAG: hypothetical protein AAGE52_02785 [Myxococcota bacterium]